MSFVKYQNTNNASSLLIADITASQTTILITDWDQSLFPSSFPFLLTLEHLDANENVILREIVKAVSWNQNSFTVERSAWICVQDDTATNRVQDNTAHAFYSWDKISLYWTAEQVADIQNNLEAKWNQDAIANVYDNTATYAVWDIVVYKGDRYVCQTAVATAEEFDSSKWIKVNIQYDLDEQDARITALENAWWSVMKVDVLLVWGWGGWWGWAQPWNYLWWWGGWAWEVKIIEWLALASKNIDVVVWNWGSWWTWWTWTWSTSSWWQWGNWWNSRFWNIVSIWGWGGWWAWYWNISWKSWWSWWWSWWSLCYQVYLCGWNYVLWWYAIWNGNNWWSFFQYWWNTPWAWWGWAKRPWWTAWLPYTNLCNSYRLTWLWWNWLFTCFWWTARALWGWGWWGWAFMCDFFCSGFLNDSAKALVCWNNLLFNGKNYWWWYWWQNNLYWQGWTANSWGGWWGWYWRCLWWAWWSWLVIVRYPKDCSYWIACATGWTITTATINGIQYVVHTFTSWTWTFSITETA